MNRNGHVNENETKIFVNEAEILLLTKLKKERNENFIRCPILPMSDITLKTTIDVYHQEYIIIRVTIHPYACGRMLSAENCTRDCTGLYSGTVLQMFLLECI